MQLENERLKLIDESDYVLTLDYTIKMLNIHERHECGVPVIIEGETGVGKTALVEMLSKLWNQSLLLEWSKEKSRLLDFLECPIDVMIDNFQVSLTVTIVSHLFSSQTSLIVNVNKNICIWDT